MWSLILTIGILLFASIGLASVVMRGRRRRACYAAAKKAFLSSSPEDRVAALSSLLSGAEKDGPAWYLLGCSHLRAYRMKEAARAFGMAHHGDCNLESAALLTFACLKAEDGEGSEIIERILETWEEMRRPEICRRIEDREIMQCLSATTRDAPTLSRLGMLIWYVTGPAHQRKIEETIAGSGPHRTALRG